MSDVRDPSNVPNGANNETDVEVSEVVRSSATTSVALASSAEREPATVVEIKSDAHFTWPSALASVVLLT